MFQGMFRKLFPGFPYGGFSAPVPVHDNYSGFSGPMRDSYTLLPDTLESSKWQEPDWLKELMDKAADVESWWSQRGWEARFALDDSVDENFFMDDVRRNNG